MRYELETTIGDETRIDEIEAPTNEVAIRIAKRSMLAMCRAAGDSELIGYLSADYSTALGGLDLRPIGVIYAYASGVVSFDKEI